ncbi:hypothetical protein BOTBODRAFT_39511 [Botryobasidium botryosum FD-172 SS1]|uniref:5'-Nucleotidase C-terminal domain-containing protein n=1 Tax=Botryobasidium botryosum (strain FD-172 SS1) TaxID=930990 RepID=A0A067LWC3_BOTB1|nr:hypothetical protein BOTBODRAFT_39511 [Botryobasidium botryosum FD-172 SS1]
MSTMLPILHFNDVYRVTKQKLPNSKEAIDVTQFAALVDSVRDSWPLEEKADGKRAGLVLFSGDVFSPSVESTITRGSHMVPVMNQLSPDVALTGNHDFDFGYPHLCGLIQDSTYPWILSNIIDSRNGQTPEHLLPFQVLERAGIRVGVIGLVEKDWITTVSSWPPEFVYESMEEVGRKLSSLLRDPQGEYRCDIIIALTHARLPNVGPKIVLQARNGLDITLIPTQDIRLAKALLAHKAPSTKASDTHGVDLILGGHDHMYYVGNGIDSWQDHAIGEEVLGAEEDDGVRVVKSGTDFREFSEMSLELIDTPPASVRRKVIKTIKGKCHQVAPSMPTCPKMTKLLEKLLSSVSKALKKPVCYTLTQWDVRSGLVRTEESAIGNWLADILRHAYDDALMSQPNPGCADGVLICGGTLRGDSVYGPGKIILGDIMEILPFEDPMVVIELDGESLWNALEAGFSMWPAQEGRFPIISGFRLEWDSRRPPGQRVLGLWLDKETSAEDQDTEVAVQKCNGEPVKREKGGRMYRLVTREYMAEGHDGYDALKGHQYLVDEENGLLFSAIVRKFLLGCQYIQRMAHGGSPHRSHSHSDIMTLATLKRVRAAAEKWLALTAAHRQQHAQIHSRPQDHTREHIADALRIGGRERMGSIDAVDGKGIRDIKHRDLPASEMGAAKVGDAAEDDGKEGDLIVVKPIVDGRMRDVGRK